MKKTNWIYKFFLAICIFAVCSISAYAENNAVGFAGGSGTPDDPYQIQDSEQLHLISSYNSSCFVLVNDIYYDNSKEWTPVFFTGTIDGCGFSIYNFTMNDASGSGLGFISSNSGTIKNLGFINCNVVGTGSSNEYSGGAICKNNTGTIQNCFVSGTVEKKGTAFTVKIGGITANNYGTISGCVNCAKIRGFGECFYIAGIAVENSGTIVDSANYGTILSRAPGEAGFSPSGITCFNRESGKIISSVAVCDMRKNEKAFDDCLSLCTYNSGIIKDCYFSSPSLTKILPENSSEGMFLSKDQLPDKANYNGLDFDTTWEMDDSGMPYPAANSVYAKSVRNMATLTNPVKGFNAQPSSYKDIKLSWEKTDNCSKYIIYRNYSGFRYGYNDMDPEIVAIVDGNTTQYIDEVGANNSEKQEYAIAPIYNLGEIEAEGWISPWSESYVVDTMGSNTTPADTAAPFIDRIKLSTNEVHTPDALLMDIDAGDYGNAGIRVIELEFKNENNTVGISKTYTGTARVNGIQSFSVQTGSPKGLYELYRVTIIDCSGNKADYNGRLFETNTLTIKDEFDIEFTGNLSNTNVQQELMNMKDGKAVVLLLDSASNGILKKELLDAIKGSEKTIVVYANPDASMQWVFYGKDISDATKNLDLNVKMEVLDGKAYGRTDQVVELTFADNGELPGITNFRLKSSYIKSIYDINGQLYLYFSSGENLQLENNNCPVIADGSQSWVYLNLSHNSKFLISGGELFKIVPPVPTDPADKTELSVKTGDNVKCEGNTYKVVSVDEKTAAFTKAKNAKSVVVPANININGETYKVTQINANAFKGSRIRTVTIGKNVEMIRKNAFKGSPATKLILKTRLLKKAKVKGCLKGSKIKTAQVKAGNKATNKKFVTNYKKIFTKANAGKKVTIRA